MQCELSLNIVITQCSSVFQLFSSKNQSLLIWRNSFFILDFCFHIIDGIICFNIQSDCFSSQCFDENLHTTSQSKNQMQCGLFLNIVIAQCSSIFQLFSSKNQSLLIWWDSFFVLDFSFDIIDGIRWFDIECDGLSGEGFDED